MRLLPQLLLASALSLAACAGARPLTLPSPPAVAAPSLAVDLHLHVTMEAAAKPFFKGAPGSGVLAGSPRTRLENQVEASQLREAGVRLALAALWPPLPLRPGRDSLAASLDQLFQLSDFAARRPDFAVVRTVPEARRALAVGRVALVPALEGGEGVATVDDLDLLYAAGLRALTVVHFVDNGLAAAAQGQLAKNLLGVAPAGLAEAGLTPLGKAAVARMVDLGIVVDLSHASDRTVEDVLAITEPKGVPVLYSHGGARALMDLERNAPDALAKRVAAGGGLLGVSVFTAQLDTAPGGQLAAHQAGTCDDFVAHWKHLADAVGPAQVALGSDFNGFIVRPAAGGLCAHGVRSSRDLPGLWAALEASGVPRAALDGMGERFLSVLAAVQAKANPEAQARALRRAAEARQRTGHLFDAP